MEQFVVYGRMQERSPSGSVAGSAPHIAIAPSNSIDSITSSKPASGSGLPSSPARNRSTQYFTRLRSQFGPLSRKTEALSRLACLQRPGFEQLDRLAAESLRLSRLIERQLQDGADLRSLVPPDPVWIEDLIEQCSDYQDRLQRQLALVAQLRGEAIELRDQLNVLAMRGRDRTGSLAFDGLRELTRRIISELVCDVTPPVLHPRLALEVLSDLLGNRADARICAVAFASAQAVARVARVTWLREDQVELVTAAALLQDCGQLLTGQAGEFSIAMSETRQVDHHPSIGAVIVAGYRNAPAGLAPLVAQHHERLNSTGSGDRTGAKQQNGFSRLLAAASRLERLRLRFAFDSDLLTPPDLAEGPAMTQFWAEARDGVWDWEMARKLLIQRDVPLTLQAALNQADHLDLLQLVDVA
ncbi:MAG: hypothetical protein JWM11_7753 [Planctomycetaceae bacterium]|nr:hypothetical protein [Planctomycetaceae bacterium]